MQCSAVQCDCQKEGTSAAQGFTTSTISVGRPIAAVILPPSAELFPYPTESEARAAAEGRWESKKR